ncbi:cell division protein FtsQ/DivIB [Aliidiomarina quisquiliarum]|uniref:cell division protein FtsQ/DivIB n=1 Tax=Aliidiomarina quisquiliarum TaxID=2938947 RepID=UPI00208F9E92|nr:cell division protein FtsQ/DivIB [Aliidiomarina quisquiliarum]
MNTQLPRQRYEFWAGLSAFIIIMLGLVVGGVWLINTLVDEEQLPITGVIIQGERTYTSNADVVRVLTAAETGSFFAADADVLRRRIEALPWVYSASVRKEWPANLRVFIVEQQPIAVWNGHELLNSSGELFAADPSVVAGTIPELVGPEGDVAEVFYQYQRIQALLAHSNHHIQRFAMSERFSVRLWLESGIELRLGREARLERVQRFMELLPIIQGESEKEIAYIDLRYDTGVAVGWHDIQPGE